MRNTRYCDSLANIFFATQSPLREPVCDFRALPIPIPPTLSRAFDLPNRLQNVNKLPFIQSAERAGLGKCFQSDRDTAVPYVLDINNTIVTVNDPAPIPETHPSEGSYHWTFERFVLPFACSSISSSHTFGQTGDKQSGEPKTNRQQSRLCRPRPSHHRSLRRRLPQPRHGRHPVLSDCRPLPHRIPVRPPSIPGPHPQI
jgi:hypothetical protein